MNIHPTAYEKAAEALNAHWGGISEWDPMDTAQRAVDAAAPVLYAYWDVDALRNAVEDQQAELARLRAALLAHCAGCCTLRWHPGQTGWDK